MDPAAAAADQMSTTPRRLLAAIDMGTNSFKLTIAYAQSSPSPPLILPIVRLSSQLHLKDPSFLSPSSVSLSLSTLRSFSLLLSSLSLPFRAFATASLRRVSNPSSLLSPALSDLNIPITILTGDQEARLVYLAVLHSLPLPQRRSLLLAVDIGGGSTEFVVGRDGDVLFSASLDLGHVTLSESLKSSDLADIRRHVRTVLHSSGVVERIKEIGFEIAVGSSGTVKAMEKAISGKGFRRRWRFGSLELQTLVQKMERNYENLGVEGLRRLGFSKRRAESAVAGAVLLGEIFELVGIEEMEVSEFALGEGVIAEMMMEEDNKGSDLKEMVEFDGSENSRWKSVVGLATRFDDCDDGRKMAEECIAIAKVLVALVLGRNDGYAVV